MLLKINCILFTIPLYEKIKNFIHFDVHLSVGQEGRFLIKCPAHFIFQISALVYLNMKLN